MVDYVGQEWHDLIGGEFEKEYMNKLASTILKDRGKHVVYPESTESIFSVFKALQPSDIKVVIIGQDPYPDGSYDGMAFSNSEDKMRISPSLRNIFKEVEDDIYKGLQLDQNPNLSRWQEQGVFLVNKVLTVRKGSPNSHANIGWEIFTNKCIQELSTNYKGIVFMLWGKKAKAMTEYISDNNHLILESGHPSPMSANQGLWFGNKHFSKCNEYLKSNNKTIIIW